MTSVDWLSLWIHSGRGCERDASMRSRFINCASDGNENQTFNGNLLPNAFCLKQPQWFTYPNDLVPSSVERSMESLSLLQTISLYCSSSYKVPFFWLFDAFYRTGMSRPSSPSFHLRQMKPAHSHASGVPTCFTETAWTWRLAAFSAGTHFGNRL